MKYTLLNELISQLEEYENYCSNNNTEPDIDNFMLRCLELKKIIPQNNKVFTSPSMSPQGDENARITQLIALMNKYLRFYLKKAFEGSPLSGPDDFGFLATLLLEGRLRKNELIEKNTMEFSSGMEVIKRLERHNMIESITDLEDKRAKLVDLTIEGKALLFKLLPKMGQIGHIATALLNESEKTFLLEILDRLNHFHSPIFHHAKKDSVDEISEKYLGKPD